MSALLSGKVALVTGAGHGIGRGHALELARQGATVVVNDLGSSVAGEGRGHDADDVVDVIRAAGGSAVADYGDVGDEEQADAMVQRAHDEFGKLDIVVNNAGIVRDRALWNMSTSWPFATIHRAVTRPAVIRVMSTQPGTSPRSRRRASPSSSRWVTRWSRADRVWMIDIGRSFLVRG